MARTKDEIIWSVITSAGDTLIRYMDEDSGALPFRAPGVSPIEELVGVALYTWACIYNYVSSQNDKMPTAKVFKEVGENYYELMTSDIKMPLAIWYQVAVDNFRADFLVRYRNGSDVKWIAVECDGHDFHERTKEQAERDRSRDRHFQAAGLSIFRFTGSEIWRDPTDVAIQIFEFASGIKKQ